LPIDIVKIDKGFIAGIGHAPAGAAIVAAVTNLAHGLGLAVTAEGVETQSQRDAIIAMECEFSQGFFYARPMSAAAISEQLGGPGPDPMHLPVPIGSASSLRARSSRSSQGLRSSA
jgi:EAL domain-containing protein (putative c-di-GMP-specific phosphodiesterase class I)